MSKIDYSTIPVATPTIVFGHNIAEQSRPELLRLIGVINAQKKDLAKTFEGSAMPASVTHEISQMNGAITAITAELDNRYFAENPTAERAPGAVATASDLG